MLRSAIERPCLHKVVYTDVRKFIILSAVSGLVSGLIDRKL